jgi:hypothetical protein
VVAKSAEFDIAEFTRGQATPLSIDDGQIVIAQRLSDRTVTPPFTRNGSYPACFAGAAPLSNRNAEFLFEPLPLFEQQWRRARGDKTQMRQIIAM